MNYMRRFIMFLLAKKQVQFAKIHPKESEEPTIKITTF